MITCDASTSAQHYFVENKRVPRYARSFVAYHGLWVICIEKIPLLNICIPIIYCKLCIFNILTCPGFA
jgi:uncharacterized protein involved in cysteine biosynthesis